MSLMTMNLTARRGVGDACGAHKAMSTHFSPVFTSAEEFVDALRKLEGEPGYKCSVASFMLSIDLGQASLAKSFEREQKTLEEGMGEGERPQQRKSGAGTNRAN